VRYSAFSYTQGKKGDENVHGILLLEEIMGQTQQVSVRPLHTLHDGVSFL